MLSAQEKASFYFDFDQYDFNPKQSELFSNWINKNENRKILIINGYCDWYGTLNYNDTLAIQRINTVYDLLKMKENIQFEANLKMNGYGERVKMKKNRHLNRRVDVFYEIIKTQKTEISNKSDKIVYDDHEVYNGQVINNENKNITPENQSLRPVDPEELIEPLEYINQYAKAKVGDKLIMNNLYFYDRSGIFVPESLPAMEELLAFMTNNPKAKIEIQGHICCQLGEDPEDIALIRSIAVHNYLVANNIDDTRLSYKSFGSTQPIHKIPEKNEKERNENRRVEILIIEN